ncbi:phosphotransferase family protein [Paenibacillus piri]|uniref:Aminoglycoside phosphotransferase domain-containing protein n=1 Tax=Paenibacillus piri TaxID=2547395 RepID=A0A4R5KW41_9BACL|nr:aminoglycoside phosphotransferase family protein [Paenibacillus piri]TDF99190.1 hypothetical protein E1757_04825 [Paenibacillus piri]
MKGLKPIGRGRTADIFEYGDGKIIKLFKEGLPQPVMENEYTTSVYIHSLGIPTPEPFELLEVDGRTGIVYERASGHTMLRIMMAKPWQINRQSRQLAELHAQIHRHTVTAMRQRQKDMLEQRIAAASLLDAEEKEQILDILDRLPEGNQLCHGDFHPDNIMVGDKCRILDWMTGMSGNPAGDAARSVLLLSTGSLPGETPKLIAAMIELMRRRLKEVYLTHYIRVSGIGSDEIEQWLLPVAAARLAEWLPDHEKQGLTELIRARLAQIRRP